MHVERSKSWAIHESEGEVEGRPWLDGSLIKSFGFRTGGKIFRGLHHRLRPLEFVFRKPKLNRIHMWGECSEATPWSFNNPPLIHSVALLVQGGCLNAPYVSSHRAYIKTSEVHLEARNRTEPWFGEVWLLWRCKCLGQSDDSTPLVLRFLQPLKKTSVLRMETKYKIFLISNLFSIRADSEIPRVGML